MKISQRKSLFSIKELTLQRCSIRHANGDPVSIDAILAMIPNVTQFEYSNQCEIHSIETWEKLNSIKLNNNLEFFGVKIFSMENEIDPQLFVDFIRINTTNYGILPRTCYFAVTFSQHLSEAYIKNVDTVFDNCRKTQNWREMIFEAQSNHYTFVLRK